MVAVPACAGPHSRLPQAQPTSQGLDEAMQANLASPPRARPEQAGAATVLTRGLCPQGL